MGKNRKVYCTKVSYLRGRCRVSWKYKTWTYKGKVTVWDKDSDWTYRTHYSYRIMRYGNPCTSKSCKRVYKR